MPDLSKLVGAKYRAIMTQQKGPWGSPAWARAGIEQLTYLALISAGPEQGQEMSNLFILTRCGV